MSIVITDIIGQPESQSLEYQAVLPPSKNIAQLICAFANADGGYIILGVSDPSNIVGLSSDFHANTIVNKAVELLTPKPSVQHQYIGYGNKNIYVIQIENSDQTISLEGKVFIRQGGSNQLLNPVEIEFVSEGYEKIIHVNAQLDIYKDRATSAKIKLIEHYQSILKILDDLGAILYPDDPELATNNPEGKVLIRILFSSLADNFETYLSDLLYEIFLAKPDSLKSKQQVTIKEVLDCADLQEFVHYWANKQIAKLQKGSVTGFIEDNSQIKSLNAIDEAQQNEIEKILQIRHLYSHRNGIVDEKFLQFFSGQFVINAEHEMAISEVLDKLSYLATVVNSIDILALDKYSLAEVSIS